MRADPTPRKRRWLRPGTVAAALGFVFGLACGTAQVLPEPTTILVRVRTQPEQEIVQFYVSGTSNGFAEFPATLLPDAGGAPFNGPQTFRIFLPDKVVTVAVEVSGINAEGDPVAAGTTKVTTTLHGEVEADIDLSPTADAGHDAGIDASIPDAGPCTCGTTCCAAGTDTCDIPKEIEFDRINHREIPVVECGETAMVCSDSCDPLRTYGCTNGKCACGSSGVCPVGTRCAGVGPDGGLPLACVCDLYSNCKGCCDGNDCIALTVEKSSTCGAGGTACIACPLSAIDACGAPGAHQGTCTASLRSCDAGTCQSADSCLPERWPTCIGTPVSGRCTSCDLIRSNTCRNDTNFTGCACGNGNPCADDQYCNNAGTCVPLR